MILDVSILALVALLLPAAAFLLLAIAAPMRRLGRPAAAVSILATAASLAVAVLVWRDHAGGTVTRLVWEWIPTAGLPLAEVGVLADADSAVMLVLVALVSLLVQVYSLSYLDTEPPRGMGR
jgi:NADH-quinone oxidoreductase subunit L